MKQSKTVVDIVRDQPTHWVGDGFPVRSLLSYRPSPEAVSPFLLLDYAAPHRFSPGSHQRGVGQHPHRGFETVTIAYQGELEHRDSSGATGKLGPGDVQWMTAGSGILHEERHSRAFTQKGGTLQMVQFWVNLPKRDKMSAPRYQDLKAEQIPSVDLAGGGGRARVIAGELHGMKGPAKTFSPINVFDVRLHQSTTLELPEGHMVALLVLSGSLRVGGETVGPVQLALLSHKGTSVALEVTGETSVLLLSGAPLGEPVAGHGPFVMNTKQELLEAFADFQAGRLDKRGRKSVGTAR